jgi:hypothetical protein
LAVVVMIEGRALGRRVIDAQADRGDFLLSLQKEGAVCRLLTVGATAQPPRMPDQALVGECRGQLWRARDLPPRSGVLRQSAGLALAHTSP